MGYVGISKIHAKAKTPIKKPRNGELSKKQKQKNKTFRRKRVKVEHVIRRCKTFKIVKEQFRNSRDKLQNVWSIICGIVNLKI